MSREKLTGFQREQYDKGQELARELEQSLNAMGSHAPAGFIDYMTNNAHRTLQQQVFQVFLKWAFRLADTKEGWFDLRNEASVKAARKIKEALGDYGDCLPFI